MYVTYHSHACLKAKYLSDLVCLLQSLGVPDHALGWIPMHFVGRYINLRNFHGHYHSAYIHCVCCTCMCCYMPHIPCVLVISSE